MELTLTSISATVRSQASDLGSLFSFGKEGARRRTEALGYLFESTKGLYNRMSEANIAPANRIGSFMGVFYPCLAAGLADWASKELFKNLPFGEKYREDAVNNFSKVVSAIALYSVAGLGLLGTNKAEIAFKGGLKKAIMWGLGFYIAKQFIERALFYVTYAFFGDTHSAPAEESTDVNKRGENPDFRTTYLKLVGAIADAVIFEILFRGLLMGYLCTKMHFRYALFLSSGIGMFFRMDNTKGVAYQFYSELLLGLSYGMSGNVFAPVVFRAIENLRNQKPVHKDDNASGSGSES